MIVTEILAQAVWPTGHIGRSQHGDRHVRIHDLAQGYRTVVTTQAQDRRARRLTGRGMRGTAGIRRIGEARVVPVP